jgi:hypothetical protein
MSLVAHPIARTSFGAVLVALMVAACSPAQPTQSFLPTSASPVPQTVDNPTIGVPYPLRIPSACGLQSIVLDGSDWAFEGYPAPYPPHGFHAPFDVGTLTFADEDHAVYRSSEGISVDLTRIERAPSYPPCP